MPDPRKYHGYGQEEQDPYSIRKWAPTVIRGAGALAPPLLPGAAINAALELGAQTLEDRPNYNWAQVGTQAGLGAIPFGKAANLAKTVGKGALLGAGSTLATQQAETGIHTPTEEDVRGLALGGLLGGAGGGLAYGIGKKLGAKGIGKTPEADVPNVSKKTGTSFEPGSIPEPIIKSGTIGIEPQNIQMGVSPSPTISTWPGGMPVGGGRIRPETPTVTTPEFTTSSGLKGPVVEDPEFTTKTGLRGPSKKSTKAPKGVVFNPQTGKIELEGEVSTATLGGKKKPAKVTSTITGETVHPVTGKKITTQVVEEAGGTKKNEKIQPAQEPLESRKRPQVDPVTGRPIKAAADIVETKPGEMSEISDLGTEVDRDSAISMLTNLYQGDMKTIAAKELVQNSLDNVRPQGINGKVDVDFDDKLHTVSVTDNGTGMTPNQVKTVYMIIGKSGKKAGSMDIGGYGVAKAAFQLGGKDFTIETIAKDVDGKIKKTSFTGTPEDFKQKRITAKIEEMPEGTPTGTKVTVGFNPGESSYDARQFIENVGTYSGTEGKLRTRWNWDTSRYNIDEINYKDVPNSVRNTGKVLAKESHPEADLTLIMPEKVEQGRFGRVNIRLMNKGMYQGSMQMETGGAVIPREVMLDISSKVDALDKTYPFTPSRESLKRITERRVEKIVNEHVLDAANKLRQNELQTLYDNVPTADFQNASNKSFHFLDPKGQVGSDEMAVLEQSEILNGISLTWGDLVTQMINKMAPKYPHWGDHVEKIGFMFTEPGYYGVHVPNPTTKKGAVFINPFNHFVEADGKTLINPLEAAYNMHHTMVHEVAHSPIMAGKSLTPHESAKFEEMIGEAYAKLNVRSDQQRAAIVGAISDDDGQTYSRGVQELLSWYQATVGRPATTEDLLSGTGIKSAASGGGMENPLGRNIKSTGGGITPPGRSGSGSSSPPKPPSKPPSVTIPGEGHGKTPPVENPWEAFKKLSAWGKIKHLMGEQRQAQTTMDMSFPFRQGIAAVTRPEFWKNIGPMMQSFTSEESFNRLLKEIEARPRFNQMYNSGVEFTHLSKELGKTKGREEALQGTLLEHILPPVRWSNRAYTAIANKMRADLFDSLAKDMEKAGVDLGDGKNVNAKALANMVNDMTGRGKLPFNLERIANEVNHVFFSPKLIASRLNLFRRAFQDPRMLQGVDDKAAKVLRKEALRSMLGIGGMAVTGAGISSAMFNEPDAASPLSADFGKFKVGDTRIDMTGGFQQYVRAAAQMASGMAKVDGEMRDRNRAMTGERFIRAKLAPIASTIVDWMAGKDVIGEEFEWGKEAKGLVTPLIINDLMEIAKEDPDMLPITTPASFFGAGVQSYGRSKIEKGEKRRKSSKQSGRKGTPQMFKIPQVKLYQPGT